MGHGWKVCPKWSKITTKNIKREKYHVIYSILIISQNKENQIIYKFKVNLYAPTLLNFYTYTQSNYLVMPHI